MRRRCARPWVETKADRRARIAEISTHGSLFIQLLVQQAQEAHDQCNAWKVEIGARATYCSDVTESVISGDGSGLGTHWTEWIDLNSLPAGVRSKLAETLEDELSPAELNTIAFGRRSRQAAATPPPPSTPPSPLNEAVRSPRSRERRELFARADGLLLATKPPPPPPGAEAKVDSGLSILRREKMRTSALQV